MYIPVFDMGQLYRAFRFDIYVYSLQPSWLQSFCFTYVYSLQSSWLQYHMYLYIYISIFTNIYIYIVLHYFSMSLTHVDLFPTPFMLLNFRCACLLVNYTSPAQKVVDGVGRYLSSSDIRQLKNPVELETLLSKAWATLQDAAYDSVDQKVKHKVFWQVVYQSLAFPAQKKI